MSCCSRGTKQSHKTNKLQKFKDVALKVASHTLLTHYPTTYSTSGSHHLVSSCSNNIYLLLMTSLLEKPARAGPFPGRPGWLLGCFHGHVVGHVATRAGPIGPLGLEPTHSLKSESRLHFIHPPRPISRPWLDGALTIVLHTLGNGT